MDWLFIPENAPAVGAISLLLSVLGTVLTLIGLYITFRQARKAASSAEVATSAVRDFKFRVSHQDASRDISEASYALDTTRRHLSNTAWRDAVDSYEDARRAFIRMLMVLPNLPEEVKSRITSSVDQMAKFCDKVDAALSNKGPYPDPSKAKIVIRRNYELLASVQKVLEESLGA